MSKLREDGYSEVVHWQKNTFTVPFGKAGKEFALEVSRLLRAYIDGTAHESIPLKASTALFALLYRNLLITRNKRITLFAWRNAYLVGRKEILLNCFGRDAQFSLG